MDNTAASSGRRLDSPYASMESKRKQLNSALGSCFAAGVNKTDVSYGDVIERNSDWPALFQQVDQLVQTINRVDRNALQKKAKECSEHLLVIQNKIGRGDYGDMSPQVAVNLAQGAYQVASELEFFSVTYYKVAALAAAMNRTVEEMLAYLEQLKKEKASK